jgi:anti-sigma B factor antagonist
MGQMLSMRMSDDQGCAVVWLRGELDAAEAADALAFFLDVAERGWDRVVVDVTDLVFVDAAGLGALVSAARLVTGEDGWLRLADASPMLRRMLRILGLTDVLPVYESVRAAVAAGVSTP